MKDDPRFVKGFLRLFGNLDGRAYEKLLPYRKCTDADWELFAPPAEDALPLAHIYRTSPNRNLFCIDWDKFGD